MDQVESASAEQVLELVAEHALDGWTGVKSGAVRTEDRDHVRGVHDQRPEAFLALLQALLCPLALPPGLRFFQPPLHGGAQAREVPLHDVVVSPGLHRLYGGFLPDLPRDDDERRLRPRRTEHRQSLRRLEARHLPVGEDHVPRPSFRERPPHRLRGVHPLVDGLVPPALELAQEQHGVVLGVLHDQDAQPDARTGGNSPRIRLHRDSSPSSSAETRPTCTAWSAAWVRLFTFSFERILWTWDLIVDSSMESSRAICLLALPWAMSFSTSVSRSVSASGLSGARTSRISLAAASGASCTLPAAAALIASHSSSASVVFRR